MEGAHQLVSFSISQSLAAINLLLLNQTTEAKRSEMKRKKFSLLLKKVFCLNQKGLFHHNERKHSDEG